MDTQQDHVQVEADKARREEYVSKKIRSIIEIDTDKFINIYRDNVSLYLSGENAAVAVDQLIQSLLEYAKQEEHGY